MDNLVPAEMTDAAMLAVIIGFFSPIVLNFIVSATWPTWAKSLTAFVWSAVIGTLAAVVAGAYLGLAIPSAILLTLVVSITSYQQFWRPVGLTNRNQEQKDALRA